MCLSVYNSWTFVHVQEIEPSVGEQLLRLWDKPPMTQHPQSARYAGHPPQLGANSSHGQVDYANPNRNQSGHHGNQYSAWSPNQKSYGQWTTPGVRGNQQSNQGYPGGSYPVMARMDEMNAASQMGSSSGIPMGGHQGYGQGYGSQRGQGQFQKGYNMTPSPSMQGSSSSSSVMIMQRSTTDPNAKNTGSMWWTRSSLWLTGGQSGRRDHHLKEEVLSWRLEKLLRRRRQVSVNYLQYWRCPSGWRCACDERYLIGGHSQEIGRGYRWNTFRTTSSLKRSSPSCFELTFALLLHWTSSSRWFVCRSSFGGSSFLTFVNLIWICFYSSSYRRFAEIRFALWLFHICFSCHLYAKGQMLHLVEMTFDRCKV